MSTEQTIDSSTEFTEKFVLFNSHILSTLNIFSSLLHFEVFFSLLEGINGSSSAGASAGAEVN